MVYQQVRPDVGLADRVACYWTLDAGDAGGGPSMARIVPDGCMDIIWGPDGLRFAGADTRAHLVMRRSGSYLAVRFLPGGAGRAFGVAADALTDARGPLRELLGERYDWAPPRGIEDLGRFAASIREVVRSCEPPDPAIAVIRAGLATGRPVAEVAERVGMSERTLRRRSFSTFGYGPKTLQRILRFQRALVASRSGIPLAQAAVESGYADQAHMSGEVRRLTGVPITRL